MEEEFLQKLGELLKEYNASIEFTCAECSDTYGLYDDGISVKIGGKEIKKTHCWCLEASDLKSTKSKARKYVTEYKPIK